MLTLFGSIAVAIMFLTYWLEGRSKWMVLLFAGGSALTSVYSGLVAAYPITVIEALWACAPALPVTAPGGKAGGRIGPLKRATDGSGEARYATPPLIPSFVRKGNQGLWAYGCS